MNASKKHLQFPAPTGAYKVFVKDKGLWQKFSHARLHISIGNPKHDGEKFYALAEWAAKRFERITLIVSDTVQRHNITLRTGRNASEARALALHMGDQWIMRNTPAIELFSNVEITRWDDWLDQPAYEPIYDALLETFATDANLRATIRAKAIAFTKREKQIDDNNLAFQAVNTSITYILEEIAAFALMFSKDNAVDVYPGEWFNDIFVAVSERNISPLLTSLEDVHCLRVDFTRNKQAVGNDNSALQSLIEGMNTYRDKTRQAIKHLKQYRRVYKSHFAYMPRWEEPSLVKEVSDIFAQYLRFHKGYYALRRHKQAV